MADHAWTVVVRLSVSHHHSTHDANCFAILHQLCSIQRSVPTSVYHTLDVLSQLDDGNAMLVGLQPSAVSAQRCCVIHRRSMTLRPRHQHTRQFPLVEGPGACSVQAGDNRLSFTEWYGSSLPDSRSGARFTKNIMPH